jgi:hypothetical protein
MTRTTCPSWCSLDPGDGHPRHRGATEHVTATVEGRGTIGRHETGLVVELARDRDALAIWLYVGDGWTGFSLSLDSAARLLAAVQKALRAAGTLERTGL